MLPIGAWSLYNTVRYFLAFSAYNDSVGQTICLALGTGAGVSFALSLCSLFLTIQRRRPLVFGVPYKYLTHIRSTLLYGASFFLLSPAAVNFSLTFLWKSSKNPQFNLRTRCHLDVDVVWSVARNQCTDKFRSWSVWVVLSSLRLFLTLVVVVSSSLQMLRVD